jgi:hypothetical protein
MKKLFLLIALLLFFIAEPLRAEPTLTEVDNVFMKLLDGVKLPVNTEGGNQRERAYQKLMLEFIYSPKYAALREEYRVAMDGYIEGGVDRAFFSEVMAELGAKVRRHRNLAKNLIEPSYGAGQFEIVGETKVSGRTVNVPAWNEKLDHSIETLKSQAAPLLRMKPKDRLEYVRSSVQLLEKALSDDMKALEEKYGDKTRAIHKHHGELIQQIKQDPSFKALAAYVSLQNITTPPFRDQLRSGSADVIFYAMEELKSYPEQTLKDYGVEDVRAVAALFREPIPDMRRVIEDRNLFPGEKVATSRGKLVDAEKLGEATTFTFRPSPRPFHAIWKGTCYTECVRTRPARFLTAALGGAIFHFVEENGQNRGWTQMIPGVSEDGHQYASVDFGSRVFNRSVTVRDKNTGELKAKNFFDLWLNAVKESVQTRFRGLLVGHSSSGDNAGVLGIIRRSAAFVLGAPVMDSADFVPQDQMALKYGRAPWWKFWDGYLRLYNEKRMLYDATIPSAGDLIQLAYVKKNSSSAELLDYMLMFSGVPDKLRIAVDMIKRGVEPALFAELVDRMREYNGSELIRLEGVRNIADSTLPAERRTAILREALKSRSQKIEAAAAVGLMQMGEADSAVLDAAMKDFRRSNFYRFMHKSDFELLLKVVESGVPLSEKQADEMFDFLLRERPSTVTMRWHERVLSEVLKRWPGHTRTDEVFLELMTGKDIPSQLAALRVLAAQPEVSHLQQKIVRTLLKAAPEVRIEAAGILVKMDDMEARALDVLIEASRRGTPWSRARAVELLQSSKSDQKLLLLADALGDPELVVRLTAERFFQRRIEPDGSVEPLPNDVVIRMFQSSERLRMNGRDQLGEKVRDLASHWDKESRLRLTALQSPLPEVDRSFGATCNRWWKQIRRH